MPVYLKIEKPYYIGGEFRQYFDYNIPYNEETEVEGEPEGDGVHLIEALTEELNELEYIDNQKVLGKILEDLEAYDGGFTSDTFFTALKNRAELIDAYSGDEKVKIGNLFRDIILKSGFDGVIMDASAFKDMKGTQNTNHYIVYKSNQIKSIFNRNTTS